MDGGRFAQELGERDVGRCKDHFAGFDLGQVENFADQRQQVLAAAVNYVGVFQLVGLGQFRLQQFGKAEDAIERCPQFV